MYSFFNEKRLKIPIHYNNINKVMKVIKLKLSSNAILDKKFESTSKGYNPLEVDTFLDTIISDYMVVESNVLALKRDVDNLISKINDLEKQKRVLEVENGRYRTRFANIKESDNVTSDNIEYIKRINALEKFLWEKGYNPKDIK